MAKAKTRIYAVGGPGGVSLVRAYSSQQAVSYIASKAFSAQVAGQELLLKLTKDGIPVEDAAKPETADLLAQDENGPIVVTESVGQAPEVGVERSSHITEVA